MRLKTFALNSAVIATTLATGAAFAGASTPLSELSRYNDPIGSARTPAAVSRSDESASGGRTYDAAEAARLRELSRFNDPIGSGERPEVVARPGASADAAARGPRPLSELSRWNDPIGPQS